ncbi:MAG: PKD domain-containing protein [Candidatus Woesearchaeota archaeon]
MKRLILFSIVLLIALVTASGVFAALCDGNWELTQAKTATIKQGESAFFNYYIHAVSNNPCGSDCGQYSIYLYNAGGTYPLHTYYEDQSTINNGATGSLTVDASLYNTVGTYQVLITCKDAYSSDYSLLTLNVIPKNDTPHPLTVSCRLNQTTGVAPTSISFYATATGGLAPLGYKWDFDNGDHAYTSNTLYTYQNPGTYYPKITVTDRNNRTATANCDVVTITQKPTDPITATCNANPTSGNTPLNVQFNLSNIQGGTGTYTNYKFTFGNGNTQNKNTPTNTQTYTTGTYNPTVTITDSNENNGAITCPTITVNPKIDRLTATCHVEPTTGIEPLDVNFTVQVADGTAPYRYRYIFDDGKQLNTTLTQVTHQYTKGGYWPLVVVKDNANSEYVAMCDSIILVGAKPDQPLNGTCTFTPTQGIVPLNVTFTTQATGGSGNYKYYYNFGNNFYTTTTSQTLIIPFINPGTYRPQVEIEDTTTGNRTTIACNNGETLIVNPQPPDPITATCNANPTNGNTPLNVQFNLSNIQGGTGTYTNYKFTFGNGNTQNKNTPTNTQTYTTGTYNPTVTITDSNENNGTITCPTITVNPIIPPTPITGTCNANPTNGNTPLNVQFNLSTIRGGTGTYTAYGWDFLGTNNFISTISNPQYNYLNAGTYTPQVRITDSNGSTGIITCQSITATTIPPAFSASCTATPASGYAPLFVTFSAQASNGNSPYIYTWNLGNGNTGTGVSTSNTYNTAGTYYSQVTVRDSTNQQITVNCNSGNPIVVTTIPVSITANAGGPYIAYVNNAIMFNGSLSTGPIVQYRWNFGDGSANVQSPSPYYAHAYNRTGVFTVQLTIYDVTGNSASAFTTTTILASAPVITKPVVKEEESGLFIGKIRITGRNGIQDFVKNTDDVTISVELENDGRKLNDARLIIEIPELAIKVKGQSFDLSRNDEETETITFQVDNAPSGIYMVKITVQDDNTKRSKYREMYVGSVRTCSGFCFAPELV